MHDSPAMWNVSMRYEIAVCSRFLPASALEFHLHCGPFLFFFFFFFNLFVDWPKWEGMDSALFHEELMGLAKIKV